MKIVMVTSYPPDKCGISDYSHNLVKSLRAHAKVVVISRKGDSENGIIHRKNVKRSWLQIIEELRTFPQAAEDVAKCMKIIEKEKPDALHIQYEPGLYNLFFTPMLFDALRKNFPMIKKILTLHAIDYFPLNLFHKLFLYKKPDRIIVHTEYHKNIIKKINKNTIKIPMGLAPKTTKSAIKDYVLYFGFLSVHKGIENLIRSYDKIKDKTRIKLIIAGSINPAYKQQQDYRDKIKNMIERLGLSDSIDFIYNYIPAKRLERTIADAKFVVFPYLKSYSGGQSQAIMDAVSIGKPVIVSKLPGLTENIVNGKNGIIVTPDNENDLAQAMRKLSSSNKLLNKISSNNKNLARCLSWKNIARKTIAAYNS